MTDKLIDDLPAASALAGADLVPVRQGGVTKKATVTQVAAAAAGGSYTPPTGTGFPHITSGAQDVAAKTATETTALLDAFVGSGASHAKGLVPDPGVTSGTAKFLREDSVWADPRLVGVSLTQEFETPTPGNTLSCLVDTTNDGVICLGTSGAYGKFNWTTFAWATGTVSGPSAISYNWAIYIPSIDKIWAANTGGTVHLITPATMAATDISAATGALLKAAYCSTNGLVYGIIAGSTTIRELNATTGVLARSYAPTAFALGMIGCHPSTGFIYAQTTTNGSSGSSLLVIDPSSFSAVSQTITGPSGTAMAANFGACFPAFMPSNNKVIFADPTAYANIYDTNAATIKKMSTRLPAGAWARYSSATGKLYILYCTSKFVIGRLDAATPLLATETLAQLINAGSGGTASVDACVSADGRIYVLTNASTLLRIIP